ncbi:MAG TPA: MT-A70 family methyltransferase [Solirubrobacterales bacterium]|nr:MT-A70 family methyltransferase [Solirubrobacterales bacterium]
MGEYRTIVADPPWELPSRKMRPGGRRASATEVPYSFMSLEEIEALQVAEWAADNCALFLWSTRRNFREGVAAAVARAWGFEPCAEIMWGLRNPGLGTPRALAADHEPILVAKRGSPDWRAGEPMGVHFWRQPYYPRGGGKIHSAKPEAFLDHVEQWSPGPYLELFARRDRLGWDTWGNECLNTIRTPALAGGASQMTVDDVLAEMEGT